MASTEWRFDDEGLSTATSEEQRQTEDSCAAWLAAGRDSEVVPTRDSASQATPRLLRDAHIAYLTRSLRGPLSAALSSLDASRVWILYWTLHSLDLLRARPADSLLHGAVEVLSRSQWLPPAGAGGGFGGGLWQLPHVISCYAAVSALVVVGTPEAFDSLLHRRQALYAFFLRCKSETRGLSCPVGSFRVQGDDGEADVRGAYAVLAVSAHLAMLTPRLVAGVAEFVLSCQSHEGGFGGDPGSEAHGGYTFCAVAALEILGALPLARVPQLWRWLLLRQQQLEGGFAGRVNKLVDGCYSFWQGAAVAIVARHMHAEPTWPVAALQGKADAEASGSSAIFSASGESAGVGGSAGGAWYSSSARLARYVLACCQQPGGGLRDKPSKSRDFYHSCYCLSGLSIAVRAAASAADPAAGTEPAAAVGETLAALAATDPVFNVRPELAEAARAFFSSRPAME